MSPPPIDPHELRHTGTDIRPAHIGRMLILAKLGEGGMGVVHAAYDPELDRKVAVKTLRPDRVGNDEGRTRLLREAQALARLAHPNVVSIHDVGTDGHLVWLAMEFIQGKTVAAWLHERVRPWREVIHVFLQATRGIEAAHRAGLLHRDVKPANIMIGDDGRVRVMDFGLVRSGLTGEDSGARLVTEESVPVGSDLTRTGARMGTPAYMAPEQILGFTADERSDQYSLCVALWEALYGERPFATESFASRAMTVLSGQRTPPRNRPPVPRWLRRVVERGLAPKREARFATMAELRRALESDPTRRRWALGLGLTAAVGVAAWFGASRVRHERAIAACSTLGAAIDEVWNDTARTRLREALIGTGASFAVATYEKATPWIDTYADAWRQARIAVCRAATVERAWPAELAHEAEACLDERRHHLETVLGVFSDPTTDEVARGLAENMVSTAAKLPRLDPCQDPVRLRALPRAPDDEAARQSLRLFRTLLAESTALQRMGMSKQALARAEEAARMADALGNPRLQAAAATSLGAAANRIGDYKRAEPLLESGYFDGGALGDDAVQSFAAQNLTFMVGHRLARPDDGLRWGRATLMVLDRAGVPADDLRRAPVLGHLGLIHDRLGDYARADAFMEKSRRISEQHLGPSHPEVAAALHNRGQMQMRRGNVDKATDLLNRALAANEQTLGENHPQTAESRNALAVIYGQHGDLDRASELFVRTLAIQREAVGDEHQSVAGTLTSMANVHERRGDLDHARALLMQAHGIYERTQGVGGPETVRLLTHIGEIYRKQAAYDAAEPLFTRALELIEQRAGPESDELVSPLASLGILYRIQGEYDKAIAVLERAIRIESKAKGPESGEVATSLHALGLVHGAQKRYDRAAESLEKALAIWEKSPATKQSNIASGLSNLGIMYFRRGEVGRAIGALRRSLQIYDSIDPEGSGVAHPLTFLGTALTDQKQHDEAVPLLRRALGLREKQPGDPASLAETRFALAKALWPQTSERPAAQALARQARDGFAKRGAVHATDLRDVEAWLKKNRP